MTTTSACPCDVFVHPAAIGNAPGLDVIRYRVGDYAAFREALLRPLGGEIALRLWRPGARDDLAVQIVEWFAYLADILTFYDERIANQQYLRTADLPENVRHIVRLLGYRPRPGIGATGQVAALIQGPKPVVIPAGFQIQSKPGPGQSPQTFEVDQAVTASLPDKAPADPPPIPGGASVSDMLFAGQDVRVSAGEKLLVVNKGWAAAASGFRALVTVKGSAVEQDPRGNRNTRVTFTPSISPGSFGPGDLRVMRSMSSIPLWGYKGTFVSSTEVHLAALAREIQPGDIVAFDKGGASPTFTPVLVKTNSELVWFANSDDPAKSPDPNTTVPIPILHTILGFSGTIDANAITTDRASTRVRYAWADVGAPIPTPAASVTGPTLGLTAAPGASFPTLPAGAAVLVQDGEGDGAAATLQSGSSSTSLSLGDAGTATLKSPLDVLFNVLPVSRGKTVTGEVLGSGDATVAGQEFVLKKSPLTYLPSADPASPDGYRSTLRVFVDGIEWKEAPSFYGQSPNAPVFVTREDDDNTTHIMFGDGVRGSRLSSGANNVVARYRYESGAELPDTGKLTVVLKPIPGLKGIVNPVQPFGGADPDPPGRLRTLAPRSVLTFGRAVSGSDYEAIAAATPGVARAKAYWAFNAARQQTVVKVYVGDTEGAVVATKQALARAADPNRPFTVELATAAPMVVGISVLRAEGFQKDLVKAALVEALMDEETGLFGKKAMRIGQTIFRSQIYEACLKVAGVAAVNALVVPYAGSYAAKNYRFYAGEGKFFEVKPEWLFVKVEDPPSA